MRRSPYFILSVVLTACTIGAWTNEKWFEDPIGVLPNLLGFSLGALTIFLGFGSEAFRDFLAGPTDGNSASPFVAATTTFVHFILVQCLSLLAALVIRACFSVQIPQAIVDHAPWIYSANEALRSVLWAVGYWLFLYALVLALSAVLSMFQLAKIFNAFRISEHEKRAAMLEHERAKHAAARKIRPLPKRGHRGSAGPERR